MELPRLVLARGSIEPEEAERAERVLATARVLFAAAAFVAIYIDPTEPTQYYFFAYTLLLTYVLYSVGVLIALTLPKSPVEFPRIGQCAADLIWVSILTFFTQGPNSPFFLFFTFVLVASACRWGFWETVATGVIVGLLNVVQGAVVTAGFSRSAFTENGYDLKHFIIQPAYVLIISVLLGYLAHVDKRLKAETSIN